MSLKQLHNLDRSSQWQLRDCSDWQGQRQKQNEENESESVLELGEDEVRQGGRTIEMIMFIDQVIGAMKSNLPKDIPQSPSSGNTARHK